MTNIAKETEKPSLGGSAFNDGLGNNLALIFVLNEISRNIILDKMCCIGRLKNQLTKHEQELNGLIEKHLKKYKP